MATDMFKVNVLVIPDFVIPSDVEKVKKYFNDYNIAELSAVEYFDHPEEEYYCEEKSFYGFMIIKIKKWHDNTMSKNFYETLLDNKCKMVHDDPYYWDLEFGDNIDEMNLNNRLISEEDNNKVDIPINNPPDESEYQEDDKYSEKNLDNDEEYDEDYDSYVSESEQDDEKDLDYKFSETDGEDDYCYEYVLPFYKKIDNKVTSAKRRKYNTNTVSENNLSDALIKKNKNYLKNNKRKDYKNEWTRRLRTKLNA